MQTLAIRFTRPDHATVPGGIILRKRVRGDGSEEFIAHNFARDRGSREPTSFFWGRYCDTEADGRAAFNDKVRAAERYTTGGSLIDDYRVDRELAAELEQETSK